VVLHDYALYKSTFTLLYFTAGKRKAQTRGTKERIRRYAESDASGIATQ